MNKIIFGLVVINDNGFIKGEIILSVFNKHDSKYDLKQANEEYFEYYYYFLVPINNFPVKTAVLQNRDYNPEMQFLKTHRKSKSSNFNQNRMKDEEIPGKIKVLSFYPEDHLKKGTITNLDACLYEGIKIQIQTLNEYWKKGSYYFIK